MGRGALVGTKFAPGEYIRFGVPIDTTIGNEADALCAFYVPLDPNKSIPEYHEYLGQFITDGCEPYPSLDPSMFGCRCDHLTSFAVRPLNFVLILERNLIFTLGSAGYHWWRKE